MSKLKLELDDCEIDLITSALGLAAEIDNEDDARLFRELLERIQAQANDAWKWK